MFSRSRYLALAAMGVVFGLRSQPGRAADTYSLIHTFIGASGVAGPGGGAPGPLVARTDSGPAGWALYGVASTGGAVYDSEDPTAPTCPHGCGIVYKLTPPPAGGLHWSLTRLYVFKGGAGGDGTTPIGALTFDAAGAAYGATAGGIFGTVYRLTPPRTGQYFWNQTILKRIGDQQYGEPGGGFPQSGLAVDASGALYGAASGEINSSGSIYQLTPPAPGATTWTSATLVTFEGPFDGSDYPESANSGPLTVDPSGSVYGIVSFDPASTDLAEVFRLTPPVPGHGGWRYSVLYKPEINGYRITRTGILRDRTGTLYFSASGGPGGAGAVFSLTPPGTGQTSWTPALLHGFSGADGYNPGDLTLLDGSGAIYGSADGTNSVPETGAVVFRLDPPVSGKTAWTETVLHAFSAADASGLEGALTRDLAGTLYSTARSAGSGYYGTAFKLTPE